MGPGRIELQRRRINLANLLFRDSAHPTPPNTPLHHHHLNQKNFLFLFHYQLSLFYSITNFPLFLFFILLFHYQPSPNLKQKIESFPAFSPFPFSFIFARVSKKPIIAALQPPHHHRTRWLAIHQNGLL